MARAPILTELAERWIINEPLQKADAIVVPGGGVGWRPIEAARLYHEGYAPKILIMDVKPDTAVDLELRQSEGSLMRQVLIKKGVPDTNIITVGKASSSTYADLTAARDWAIGEGNGAKGEAVSGKGEAGRSPSPDLRSPISEHRLLIVTDLFHTRRLKWVAKRVLNKAGLESAVRAVTPPEYTATNWWRHEEGLIMFQNEVIKFGFYRLKY